LYPPPDRRPPTAATAAPARDITGTITGTTTGTNTGTTAGTAAGTVAIGTG